MSDYWFWRHCRPVSCRTTWESHGFLLHWYPIRPRPRSHSRWIHCPASWLALGFLGSFHRLLLDRWWTLDPSTRNKSHRHSETQNGQVEERNESARASERSYSRQGRCGTFSRDRFEARHHSPAQASHTIANCLLPEFIHGVYFRPPLPLVHDHNRGLCCDLWLESPDMRLSLPRPWNRVFRRTSLCRANIGCYHHQTHQEE